MEQRNIEIGDVKLKRHRLVLDSNNRKENLEKLQESLQSLIADKTADGRLSMDDVTSLISEGAINSSRVVINGKEYEKIQDVPKEYQEVVDRLRDESHQKVVTTLINQPLSKYEKAIYIGIQILSYIELNLVHQSLNQWGSMVSIPGWLMLGVSLLSGHIAYLIAKIWVERKISKAKSNNHWRYIDHERLRGIMIAFHSIPINVAMLVFSRWLLIYLFAY